MTDKKQAREFWVKETPFHATTKGFYSIHGAYSEEMKEPKGLIHVREVLPSEPDYRRMCDDLTEKLFQEKLKFEAFRKNYSGDIDYKKLAEGLAEALKYYSEMTIADSQYGKIGISDHGQVAKDAIATYRAALEGK